MMLLHKPRNYRCYKVGSQHKGRFILCLYVLTRVVWALFEVLFLLCGFLCDEVLMYDMCIANLFHVLPC